MESSVLHVAKEALSELGAILKLPPTGVTGVQPEEGGWMVTAEMLEKTSIPDSMDILGVYEMHIDPSGHIRNFNRTHLRKRGDTSG